ncbi:porin [Thiomicrorhabdus aquaedulcis]|uniref:porin n=1 Tax=Thiomicrorhabdus aquaedulcis TaxID=2211106 RepID=UPI0018D56D50|nr:porin [Thiomicrorhabdus aquaedulcis]
MSKFFGTAFLVSALIFLFGLSGATAAFAELTLTPYGSLRVQAESVVVDKAQAGEDNHYNGLRDAYSRLGVQANYLLDNGVQLGAVLEFPLDVAQMQAQDPSFFQGFYKENNGPRIAKITASSDQWGSLALGNQWLAYYNNIAYPVDYFSSFYSGFATHATFRREALTYTTPPLNGVQLTVSGVDMTDGAGTAYLDTLQTALSYQHQGVQLALAYQDSHDERANLLGVSGSYHSGAWRFATKVEQLQSHHTVVQNANPMVANLYGSYTLNDYTFKAMVSKGDGKAGKNDEADAFL